MRTDYETLRSLPPGTNVKLFTPTGKLFGEGQIESVGDSALTFLLESEITVGTMVMTHETRYEINGDSYSFDVEEAGEAHKIVLRKEVNKLREEMENSGVYVDGYKYSSDGDSIRRFDLLASPDSFWLAEDNSSIALSDGRYERIRAAFQELYRSAFARAQEVKRLIEEGLVDVRGAWLSYPESTTD